MAKLDTDRIWRALGSFFDLFPQDERIYLQTYWEAWGDLTADLWGLAFQIDRTKSVFATTATFERRNVLVQLSGLQKKPSFEFDLSSIQKTPEGAVIVRGFVPREKRTFKISDVPLQGLIRIGVDTLPYVSVNVVAIVGGIFDGYVREATFTLESASVPHEYGDSIDLNDSFFRTEIPVTVRVGQNVGDTYVDTTSSGVDLSFNASGRLQFGTPGLNYEDIQYQSLAVVGDRYVFTLPTSWGPNQSSAPALRFAHPAGEQVLVRALTPSRWTVTRSGPARVYEDSAAVMVVDHEPGVLGASAVTMRSSLELRENVDFDISVSLFPELWTQPGVSERRAGIRLEIGAQVIELYAFARAAEVGFESKHTGTGATFTSTAPFDEMPSQVELRMVRTGGTLEVRLLAVDDETDGFALTTVTVTGNRARLSLMLEDDGTDTPSRVRFDEVVRRQGEVAGSTRLENSFIVDDRYPFRYVSDVQLASVSSLRDDPRLRSQSLSTIDVVDDGTVQILRAMGDGDVFDANGIPPAGEIVIADKVLVYDGFVRDGIIFEFSIRGGIDPSILPLAVGTKFVARTREISGTAISIPKPGELWLRDLPTRDRMWATVAQEDQRHVQKLYGPLVGMDSEVSTDAYLRRVQGAWYALMSGPAVDNAHIGVHLCIGLPAAQISGVVKRTYTNHDVLGEVTERGMVILGDKGAVTHRLNPKLQGVNWAFSPGEFVEQFTPLTDGVQIWDHDKDNEWPSRFGLDPLSPERFNAFGILVDMNTLNEDTALDDAIRFALRIKPTTAKLYFHLLLTAGNEIMNVDDDGLIDDLVGICEDISFDEGAGLLPEQAPLRMGDGHRMGHGKYMGTVSVFRAHPAMGVGLFMGRGLTMGMAPLAYPCWPRDENLATEELTSTAIVDVDSGA